MADSKETKERAKSVEQLESAYNSALVKLDEARVEVRAAKQALDLALEAERFLDGAASVLGVERSSLEQEDADTLRKIVKRAQAKQEREGQAANVTVNTIVENAQLGLVGKGEA